MAASYFLKFTTNTPPFEIVGSSRDPKHAHWIELLSVMWGTSQPMTGTSGNGSVGGHGVGIAEKKPDEVICTTGDLPAIPPIYQACSSGWTYSLVTLEGVSRGQVYVRFLFSEVYIGTCRGGADSNGSPLVQFSLNSNKVEMKYLGPPAAPGTTTYDLTEATVPARAK